MCAGGFLKWRNMRLWQVKMKRVWLCCCPGCKKWMLVGKALKAKSIDKIFPVLKQCYRRWMRDWAEAPSVFSSSYYMSIIFLFYFYIILPFSNFYNKTYFVHFLFPSYLLCMNCSSANESFVVKTWSCQGWDPYADNCWKYADSQKLVSSWFSLCQVFTPIISWACVW